MSIWKRIPKPGVKEATNKSSQYILAETGEAPSSANQRLKTTRSDQMASSKDAADVAPFTISVAWP